MPACLPASPPRAKTKSLMPCGQETRSWVLCNTAQLRSFLLPLDVSAISADLRLGFFWSVFKPLAKTPSCFPRWQGVRSVSLLTYIKGGNMCQKGSIYHCWPKLQVTLKTTSSNEEKRNSEEISCTGTKQKVRLGGMNWGTFHFKEKLPRKCKRSQKCRIAFRERSCREGWIYGGWRI